MNKVELVARLTKDVDYKVVNDKGIARFAVASDRKFKREGEPTADFINCVAFGKTADFINKYFSKGNRIGLEGHLQSGIYTNKDGQKVYTLDVIVDEVEFVESKGNGANAQPSQGSGFMDVADSIDDEMPFN